MITNTRIILLCLLLVATAQAESPREVDEELVVTGDYFDSALADIPGSISVLSSDSLERNQTRHLDEILGAVPNLNYASGAARPRFFQIRGIGERNLYTQSVNYSVGVILDNAEVTHFSNAAALFDTEQIEVLRGPQGTRQGGNAIAGLILVRSRAPSEDFQGRARLGLSQYGGRLAEVGVGGPLGAKLGYRLALFSEQSDGYYRNRYLRRDDVNNIDERGMRLKLHLDASEKLQLRTMFARVIANNGYDAFTLENSRNTYSDQPGPDELDAKILTLEADYSGNRTQLLVIMGKNSAAVNYGYDEDWTYPEFTENFPLPGQPDEIFPYQNTDTYLRDYDQNSVEIRLKSTEDGLWFNASTRWLLGVYSRTHTTDLRRVNGFFTNDYLSRTREEADAVFLELQSQVHERLNLTLGLRYNKRNARFNDSNVLVRNTHDNTQGRRLVLDWKWRDNLYLYAQYARGFKAGGINYDHVYLTPEERPYDTETLDNYELGLRYNTPALKVRASMFYMRRNNPQLNTSQVYNNQNGTPEDTTDDFFDYIDFFTNAESGKNLGGELEFSWVIRPQLAMNLVLGVLDSEYGGNLVLFDDLDTYRIGGREQSHAPKQTLQLGVDWDLATSWRWSTHLQHRGNFYFTDGGDIRADAATLLHTRLAWERPGYALALWVRNITDADIQTHALYFGNDPRDDYTTKGYYQYGEPRHIGVEWRARLGSLR